MQIRFTKQGYEKLKKDYENLLKDRRPAVEDLSKARQMGDLSENGYYKAARSKLSFIDANLRRYVLSLKEAVIIETPSADSVSVGSKVVLENGKKEVIYHIVGDLESDPGSGKISLLSPIGKAIAGRKKGETVIITIPSGEIRYTITKIA